MKFSSRLGAAAAVATVSLALAASASAGNDRDKREHPGKAEKEHVAAVLHQNGVVKWDHIKWRNGLWEVDDALRADGHQFDLKLDPKTFAIVSKEDEGKRRILLKDEGKRVSVLKDLEAKRHAVLKDEGKRPVVTK